MKRKHSEEVAKFERAIFRGSAGGNQSFAPRLIEARYGEWC